MQPAEHYAPGSDTRDTPYDTQYVNTQMYLTPPPSNPQPNTIQPSEQYDRAATKSRAPSEPTASSDETYSKEKKGETVPTREVRPLRR